MNDIALIQRRLEEYHCSGTEEELNAIREILQEMVLAGLSRTDFSSRQPSTAGRS